MKASRFSGILGIALWAMISFVGSIDAQQVSDSLIVHLKNGDRVAIPLADIQKITFDSLRSSVERPTAASQRIQTTHSFPNPLQNRTTIVFRTERPETVDIAIFDASGNLIRRFGAINSPAGTSQVDWDCLDDYGKRVPSGHYIYEVRFQGEVIRGNMIVAK